MTAPKIIVPGQGENWCTVLKTQGDDRYLLHCPIRHPSRDTTIKPFLNNKQAVMRTSGITAMTNSILRVSIWIFNLVFEPHVPTKIQRLPACLSFSFLFRHVMVAFVFFRIVVSVISIEEQQKNKQKRQALNLLVGAWSTPCQKITSQYVILSGAWPIYRSGSTLAAPARTQPGPFPEANIIQVLIGCFADNFGWVGFLVVCFLYEVNPNTRKKHLLREKVAQMPLLT